VNAISLPLRKRMPRITFTDVDFKGIDPAQDDPMVITMEIENFTVMKTLVNQASSVDILYWKTFKKLQISESDIQYYEDQIIGFLGERVDTRGYIDLYTKFGEGKTESKTIKIRYLLVDANTSYNVLLGRPSLNQLGVIMSTPNLAMKFPSPSGDVITVHVNQKTTRECYVASLKIEPTYQGREAEKALVRVRERSLGHEHMVALANLDPRVEDVQVEPGEDVSVVPLRGPEHTTKIGTSLQKEEK